MTYPVRRNKRLENAIKLGGRHVPVILTEVFDHLRECIFRQIHHVDNILHLCTSLLEEVPHLARVPVVVLDFGVELVQLFADCLQAFTKLGEAFADVLEIHCGIVLVM